MPEKESPFGWELVKKDLKVHMPQKEREVRIEKVERVNNHCTYEVTFERDEHGRIKSPITITPKT
jgi:hypothetical protein